MNGEAAPRARRGEGFINPVRTFPLEQEASLELPLGFTSAAAPNGPVAIILHAFHVGLLPEIAAYLQNIPFPADLFVSTDSETKRVQVAGCFADWHNGSVTVEVMPNRGRDIAPKLVGFASVHDRYEYVLHLHSKQSLHDDRLVGWRGYLLRTLLGSPETVRGVFAAFAQAPRLGLLAPQHIDELRPWIRWVGNYEQAEGLAQRMGLRLAREAPLDFPSGSMFWARSAALRPLLDLRLRFDDFPEEVGQTDGTLAHAIERLYFRVCEQAGFDWVKITAPGELHDRRGTVAATSPEELARFLARGALRLSTLQDVVRLDPATRVITSPPPKPRRVLHPLWRRVLGDAAELPAGLLIAIVLVGEAATSGASVGQQQGVETRVLIEPALSRNEALQAGFATGAGLVLLIDQPGLLHPDAAAALARMAHAAEGGALIEAACLPEFRPKPVDPDTLTVEWAGSPVVAITRIVFEATGGFNGELQQELADQDLSSRARALGFSTLRCPQALFGSLDDSRDGAAPMMMADQVDVILRIYDMSELPCVRACVFSLISQMLSPALAGLRIHAMTQRFTSDEVQELRGSLADLLRLDERVGLTLHNWDYRHPFDVRVPLLNLALDAIDGRYFTCLDSTDLLAPGGLAVLLRQLQATGATVALGGMQHQRVRWWGDIFVPLGTPLPLSDSENADSVFLLDRSRLDKTLRFQVSPDRQEIADFLRRVRIHDAPYREQIGKSLCVRQVFEA